MARLLIYEQAGFGDVAGTHKVYRCVRCAGSIEAARASVRDALVGSLLFAAKQLAERQFARSKRDGLICVECRTPQVADSRLRHRSWCRVGRVTGLLNGLISLDDLPFESLVDGAASFTPFLAAASVENGGAR